MSGAQNDPWWIPVGFALGAAGVAAAVIGYFVRLMYANWRTRDEQPRGPHRVPRVFVLHAGLILAISVGAMVALGIVGHLMD